MTCPSCGLERPERTACPQCGHPAADPSPWARPDPEGEDPGAGEVPPVVPPPAPAFGSPQQYLSASGASPARYAPLPPVQPAWLTQPQPKRRRLLPALVVALIVALAGGGVAAAGLWFGWFGEDRLPAQVFPATTLGYLQLDADPALAQKAQAWEFLRDLPGVREAAAGGQPDARRLLWDLVGARSPETHEVDFDRDVAPWLGYRAGMASIPVRGKEPTWALAVEVSDEAAGTAKLREWLTGTEPDADVTARDGWLLVTPSEHTAAVLADLARGTLAEDPTFAADLGSLGERGVLAGWADLDALAAAAAQSMPDSGLPDGQFQGRAAVALRFGRDVMSLDGRLFGSGAQPPVTTDGAGQLGAMPGSTTVAVSIADGARSLDRAWPEAAEMSESWLESLGLTRADLEALLGRSMSLGSSVRSPQSDDWPVGLRVDTDDVAAARAALRKLAGADPATYPVYDRVSGDLLTAATTRQYLDELSGSGPRLVDDPVFVQAVPDHARAASAGWANLPVLLGDWPQQAGEYRDFLSALRGFGVQFVVEDAGAASWSMRLVRG